MGSRPKAPARATDAIRSVAGPAPTNIVVVKDGESIQAAIKTAPKGTIIRVMPGTYHETVYVDKDDIRIIGVIEGGRRAVLDGEGKLNDAILYSGNNFVAENLEIRNYKGNGIMGQAGNNFEIRNNVITESGVYGIFPQLGQNGIVEHNVVSGIADAAIYIGMSDNILVAHNDVFDSVAGIEIENSRHAIVEHNYVHNNSGGLLAFVTPGLPIKDTVDVIFRNNFVVGNNHANFGAPGSTVAGIPAGTGILVMAADDVVIEGNVISDNKVSGIIITDHAHASNITADPGIGSELGSREDPRERDAQQRLRHDHRGQGPVACRGHGGSQEPRHRACGPEPGQLHHQSPPVRDRGRERLRRLRIHQHRDHGELSTAARTAARDQAWRARQSRVPRHLHRLPHVHRPHDRPAGADDPGAVHGQPAGPRRLHREARRRSATTIQKCLRRTISIPRRVLRWRSTCSK